MGNSFSTLSAAEQRNLYSTATAAVNWSASSYSNWIGNKRFFSQDDIQDLIQVTATKAWLHIGSFDPTKAKFSTWVGHIATNCVRDAADHILKRGGISGSPSEQDGEDGGAYGEFSVDRTVNLHELQKRVQDAVSTLSATEQRLYRYIAEEYTPKEIAAIEGCSAEAAATRCCRLRKKLKEIV